MKIHENKNGWSIELEDGTTVALSMNEVGILAERYRLMTLWEEVAMRWDSSPFWHDIEEAKDDILEDLCYGMLDDDCVIGDKVYDAIERWVDLDGVDEDEK